MQFLLKARGLILPMYTYLAVEERPWFLVDQYASHRNIAHCFFKVFTDAMKDLAVELLHTRSALTQSVLL